MMVFRSESRGLHYEESGSEIRRYFTGSQGVVVIGLSRRFYRRREVLPGGRTLYFLNRRV
jgi:hypothetical protein